MLHVAFGWRGVVPLLANKIKTPPTYGGYCLSDQLVLSHKTVTRGESFVSLPGKEQTTYRRVQLMLGAGGRGPGSQMCLHSYPLTHWVLYFFLFLFFSLSKQVSGACSVPGIILGARGAKTQFSIQKKPTCSEGGR